MFDLFDLNELESLSLIDLEFMIYCCATAAFKIYSINAEIQIDEISQFVRENFETEERVTIKYLLRY